MKRVVKMMAAGLALAAVGACSKEAVKPSNEATTTPKAGLAPTATPAGLPALEEADAAASATRAALGYTLFFDKRLSKDDSTACAACHLTDKGWATGNPTDAKVGGAANKRNTPTLLNLGYNKLFYWDGRAPTMDAVCAAAWKGQLGADPAVVAQKIAAVPAYKERFQAAFGQDPSAENIPTALGMFIRTLKSGDSGFDRFTAGDKTAMNDAAQRGWGVFQKAACVTCHTPPLFTDGAFHNVGIGSDKPEAEQDQGRADATKDAADKGRFKTPTLRDVSRTAPYFHDGSAKTLEEAITIMAAGGKANAGLDPLLKDQKLTDAEKSDLKAFLESLNGAYTYSAPATDVP